MATLRSYSATFTQVAFADAAVARWRFNEGDGTAATDSVAALDGTYQPGTAPGADGSIGDGAASFDGHGIVLVETLNGTIRVATLGDSLADPQSGFQSAGRTFADALPATLTARGLTVEYFDHAVGGERTDQGLDRVDQVIGDHPDVVILELGTNDAIQGRPIADVADNLRSIITDLHAGGIDQILLTGTFGFYPQHNHGAGYSSEADRASFEHIFDNLAADPGLHVTLLDDVDGSDNFLGGVRIPGDPDVIQGGVLDSNDGSLQVGDGLHPNALGIEQIVSRVAPQTIALGAAAGGVHEPLLLTNGSLELWFTANSVNGDHVLVAKNSLGQGTGGQFALDIRDGGAIFALGGGQNNFVAASADQVITAGEPTHLVANFGAGGMHLFIDGVEVASNAYTGGLDAGLGNFEPLVIGAESGASTPGTTDSLQKFFNGTIDEFAIYDRALTSGQIHRLFEAGEHGTTLVGTAADDQLIGGSDSETMHGGAGRDLLSGGAGNDTLYGNQGRDLLQGGNGDDVLYGNLGRDEIHGGPGDDLLNGRVGVDNLFGGPGRDTFQIDRISDGVDKIQDFQTGTDGDVLDLHSVLNFHEGDDVGNFVRLTEASGNTKVQVNADGAGSDFTTVFNLVGHTGLDLNTLVGDDNVRVAAAATS